MTGFPDHDTYFQPVSLTGKSYLKMKPNRGIATGVWSTAPTPDERSRGVFYLTEGGGADALGVVLWNGSAFAPYYPLLSETANLTYADAITFVANGMGSPIATGVAGELFVPYPFEIVAAYLFAKPSGSIQIDVWADLYTNDTPDDDDSITGAAPLAISSGVESADTTLTGWTTSHPAMTQLVFNVDSVSGVTQATVALATRRTL